MYHPHPWIYHLVHVMYLAKIIILNLGCLSLQISLLGSIIDVYLLLYLTIAWLSLYPLLTSCGLFIQHENTISSTCPSLCMSIGQWAVTGYLERFNRWCYVLIIIYFLGVIVLPTICNIVAIRVSDAICALEFIILRQYTFDLAICIPSLDLTDNIWSLLHLFVR